jgi:hypothetical protein
MIDYIEDLIPKEKQNLIEDYVKDSSFPYRFHKTHIYEQGETGNSPLQLTHHLMMYGEERVSPHFPIITSVYDSLIKLYGNITLFRAKVNCTFPDPTRTGYEPQEPHTDLKYDDGRKIPHLVCLYYINDSDGPTYFYDKDKISLAIPPKKGSAVVFDGSIIHAGSNPIHNPFRFALNINFRKGLNQIL